MGHAVRAVVAAALVLAAAADARADHWTEGPRGRRRVHHLIGVGGAAVLYAGSVALQGSLVPARCRWCTVSDFDEDARDYLLWRDPGRAATLSNLTGYVAEPLAMLGLTALGASDSGSLVDDELPILEAAGYSALVNQAVKLAVGRERPYAAFATSPLASSSETNLSFFSGHTCLTFALAVSAGEVARARGSRLEPAIWITGLTLAAATGYLRIAADKHHASDVLVGAAVGSLAGHFIPRWLGSLPRSVHVVPTAAGAGVAFAW